MELTKKERLILSNQFKILEKLYPEEADFYSVQREAIEEGFALHYDDAVKLFAEEMTNEECKEVIDILDMFRALHYSYENLDSEEKDEIDEYKIEFHGFDGNNETKQMAYTEYFINKLDRFEELRDNSEFPDYNSHSRVLSEYRRMYNKWSEFDNKRNLTKEEIEYIIEH